MCILSNKYTDLFILIHIDTIIDINIETLNLLINESERSCVGIGIPTHITVAFKPLFFTC